MGHPLLDRGAPPSRAAARETLGIPAGDRVLALFPGSRAGEIRRLWPPFRDAARILLDRGTATRVIVAATDQGDYPGSESFTLVRGASLTVAAAADAAIVKSGTVDARGGTHRHADDRALPGQRRSPAFLSRRLITVPWVSLVNLVAEREVVPEILQDEVTVARLVEAVGPLLDPAHPATRAQREGLADVRARLGTPGAAERVAGIAASLLAA